jgi:hypothetical protein
MVTPLDADPDSLPPDVTTRMILRLAKNTSTQYQKLLEAVADIPDVRNTRNSSKQSRIYQIRPSSSEKIYITSTALDGKVTRVTIEKQRQDTSSSTVKLLRSQKFNGTSVADVSLYRCVKHDIKNMPQDRRRKGRKSVLVELAFPVDLATQQPKLNEMGRHVFAYLPLQRLQQVQVSYIHSNVDFAE